MYINKFFTYLLAILALSGCTVGNYVSDSDWSVSDDTFVGTPTDLKQTQTSNMYGTYEDDVKHRIAVLLPLSGTNAQIGKSIRHSVELAVLERKSPDISVSFYDTYGNMNDTATTVLATNPQKQQIHRLKRQQGWDEDTYRNLIYQFSGGRTTSSKELTKKEATALIRQFLGTDKVKRSEWQERQAGIKAIYAISFEIPFLNQGFESSTPEEMEMNKAKIGKFVMTHGIVKKPLKDQSYEELQNTLKQFKKIASK